MNRKLFVLVIVVLAALTVATATAAAQPPAPAAGAAEFAHQPPLEAGTSPQELVAPDAFEPNNSLGAAAELIFFWVDNDDNEWVTIAPAGDLDFYKFSTQSGLATSVYLYVEESPLLLEVAVLDAAGNVLAENKTCSSQWATIDGQSYTPDDFLYLRVRPCAGQGGLTGAYFLSVSQSDRYEVEPNDTRPMAQLLHGSTYGLKGSIGAAGDRDFYRLDGLSGSAFSVYVSADQTSGLEPRVAVMDENGNILASGVGDPSWPYAVGLYGILPVDGAYYVRIIPEVGLGSYDLSVTLPYAEVEDVEPNNTPTQALSMGYRTDVNGWVDDTGDPVDYYTFNGQAGDWVMIGDEYSCNGDSDPFHTDVYGPNGALITSAQNTAFQLPASGAYLIAVTPEENGSAYYYMTLEVRVGDEPDDTPAMAQPIAYGDTIKGMQDLAYDVDVFAFSGHRGDVVDVSAYGNFDPGVILYYLAGQQKVYVEGAGSEDSSSTSLYAVLAVDATYYVEIDSMEYCSYEGGGGGPYLLWLSRAGSLYASSSQAGLGGNSAIAPADIAARNPASGQWEIAFDGSDVGLTATQNVNAFEFLEDGSLLIALGKPQTVPGVSGKVKPNDVLRFVPSSLGATTAGTWSMYLKGSTVGLTTTGEKIDAILYDHQCWNPDCARTLTISISGSGSVPAASGGALAVKDEDLIHYWWQDNGKWEMVLDGSAERYGPYDPLGLGVEDVNAAAWLPASTDWYTPDGVMLLSLNSAFAFAGLSGGVKDVVAWEYFYWGSTGGGDYFEIDYPGPWKAMTNLMGKTIDGLAIGPAWTP